ncbi:MAG: cyclic nucleotide-binding domain-containing protein [Acidimicrobiia bacterium]|nr:cyclic nucleotide-binding domain-containing protein [Acidimicrobiia bacterium]
MPKDKIALLEKVGLFRACSRKELEYIARITDEVRVEAGRVLAAKDQPGHEFFLIVDGSAIVQIDDGIQLGPGDFFGEMALLDGGPRLASVVAETDMTLIVLGHREFASLIGEVPTISRAIMKVLAQRLRDAESGHTH